MACRDRGLDLRTGSCGSPPSSLIWDTSQICSETAPARRLGCQWRPPFPALTSGVRERIQQVNERLVGERMDGCTPRGPGGEQPP